MAGSRDAGRPAQATVERCRPGSATAKRATLRQRLRPGTEWSRTVHHEAQRDEALAPEPSYPSRARQRHPWAECAVETARQSSSPSAARRHTRGLTVELSLDAGEQMQVAPRAASRPAELRAVAVPTAWRPTGFTRLPVTDAGLDVHRPGTGGPSRLRRRSRRHRDPSPRRARRQRDAAERRPSRSAARPELAAASALDGERRRRHSACAARRDHPGHEVRQRRRFWSIVSQPEVEGASVALDPRTGHIHCAGRRLRLRQEQVQSCDPGLAPAGLELQALSSTRRRWRRFSPATVINGDAVVLRDAGTTGSQPWGAEDYEPVRRPDVDASRAGQAEEQTWSRSASSSRSARATHSNG